MPSVRGNFYTFPLVLLFALSISRKDAISILRKDAKRRRRKDRRGKWFSGSLCHEPAPARPPCAIAFIFPRYNSSVSFYSWVTFFFDLASRAPPLGHTTAQP